MTPQPTADQDPPRLLFDLSGIDWNDDDAIRAASEQIWHIAVARLQGTHPPTATEKETP